MSIIVKASQSSNAWYQANQLEAQNQPKSGRFLGFQVDEPTWRVLFRGNKQFFSTLLAHGGLHEHEYSKPPMDATLDVPRSSTQDARQQTSPCPPMVISSPIWPITTSGSQIRKENHTKPKAYPISPYLSTPRWSLLGLRSNATITSVRPLFSAGARAAGSAAKGGVSSSSAGGTRARRICSKASTGRTLQRSCSDLKLLKA